MVALPDSAQMLFTERRAVGCSVASHLTFGYSRINAAGVLAVV
jgi:hypothetical protein